MRGAMAPLPGRACPRPSAFACRPKDVDARNRCGRGEPEQSNWKLLERRGLMGCMRILCELRARRLGEWESAKATLRRPQTRCGRGVARLFFRPPKRGEWRAEMTRDLDYSQVLPKRFRLGVIRGLRVRRTVRVRLANRRATAASTAICLLRVLDSTGVDSAPHSVCSRNRPGTWLCRPRPQEPHPVPHSRHLMMVPLAGRDDWDYKLPGE